MKKFPAVALLILSFLVIGAHAQGTELGSFSIYTGDSFLFIRNGEKKSLIMEIKGSPIKTVKVGENPAFDLGGKLVQVITVPLSNFTARGRDMTEEKILDLHQVWEGAYLKNEVFQDELKFEIEKTTIGERKALFWGFTRPKYKTEFDRDYFLTTVIGDHVVGLSSPIKTGASLADHKKIFNDVFATIKVSDKPFDVTVIADQVRRGTYKGD